MSERFYITTPIYYPNGQPHLGHLYTTICADTLARYHRLAGRDVFFLTGTDEHGIKMVQTAAQFETTPAELADSNAGVFVDTFKRWGISNDDFIRTTQGRHKSLVTEIVRRLLDRGDIYLGAYEGWYDEGQEEFVTETTAKAQEYKSAVSGKPLSKFSEPTYFFKLGQYAPKVQAYIEANPQFIQPESKRNEVLSKLKAGVADLSISRATLKWGIEMPNDPGHVLYVWIDALSNYITALGLPERPSRFWPADVHLIGKEILWFHAVYWPAMLLALDLPLPRTLYAHGWWVSDGKKMSKSMGNFIDLKKLDWYAATYSQDAVRYHLLRAAPFGNDLDFTEADFQKNFNELANVLGNCLNRTVKMINRYRNAVVPEASPSEDLDHRLLAETEALPGKLAAAFERLELQTCATLGIELARQTNGYIDATEPFKLAKDPAKAGRLDTVLGVSARALCVALSSLLPTLPHKAADGLRQLGIDPHSPDYGGPLLERLVQKSTAMTGTKVGDGTALFPKPPDA
jgi:methionyl-tRNA synthetase